jgi:two-component system LytT family response regulator
MSISCLIIEDNNAQNENNKSVLIKHFKEISNIKQAYNLQETKQLLQNSQPDIILADVHLGDGNVFDVLKNLKLITSKLIFTTSYSEYAIDAFKLSAISYLLKPYSDEELIAEVKKTIAQIHQENYHKQMEVFFHNLQAQQQSKRIVLKNHDLIHVVNIDDILYAQADNNYTHFFCENDKKILVSKSLKTFETELAGENFFRCHHSYLINLNKIKALHKSADAVILNNDATVPVASSKKKMLYQLLG